MDENKVPLDQAIERLVINDGSVHTFANPAGMLIGADWPLADVTEFLTKHGAQEAGEAASAMGHTIVSLGPDGKPMFFEAKREEGEPDA